MTATPPSGSTGQEHPPETPPPVQPPAQQAVKPAQKAVKQSRISVAWVSLALFAVVLLLLLVFILENSRSVDISYLGAHGHLPLGVTLLLAAVVGILLVVLVWFGRGVRVRASAHRHRKT
jgi:lipopolysaccharide assembly protein A